MGARRSLTENKLPRGNQQAKSCDLWCRLGGEREREGEGLKATREKALKQTPHKPSTMANNNSTATRGTQHI